MIIARYDVVLDQTDHKLVYNHLRNYTKLQFYICAFFGYLVSVTGSLMLDTGTGRSELPELMENREGWKTIINTVPEHARQSSSKSSIARRIHLVF